MSGARPNLRLRSVRHILLALSLLLLLTHCAPAPESQTSTAPEPVKAKQTYSSRIVEPDDTGRLNLSIEPFQTMLGAQDFKGHYSPRIRAMQGRLLAIGLKRGLSDGAAWKSIRLTPGFAALDELVLKAALSFAADLPVELSIELQDQAENMLFRNSYDLADFVPVPSDAALQPGITDPFQALFAAIDSDLQAILQSFSDKQKKQLQSAATEHYFNSRQTAVPRFSIAVTAKEGEGLSQRINQALVYEELILQTINSYFNLYYDDLLAPYSAWLASAGSSDKDASALLETESQILVRQVIGIGSVVEAIALQLSDRNAKDALAFTPLLKYPPFASYSQFQPLEERRRAQASLVGLGLITGMPEQPLVVTVDGEQMALNGSVEEQYGWWRRMIVDLVSASEEITQNTIVPGQ